MLVDTRPPALNFFGKHLTPTIVSWRDVDLFLQRCFDGTLNAAIYASLAISIVVIYRSTGLINFAQGEMAMVGGYVTLLLMTAPATVILPIRWLGVAAKLPGHPWPPWLAILAAMSVGFMLGALVERLIMRPLEKQRLLSQVNATIGLLILFNGLVIEIWGTSVRTLDSPFPNRFDDYVDVFGARLRWTTIGTWGVLLGLIVALGLLLRYTKTGLAFRAITSNRDGAALVGISVGRTLTIGWGLASAIGALAAALLGSTNLLEPTMMIKVLIYAFAAATLGGLDSPKGALIGGLIIGLAQALIPGYLGVPTELSLLPALAALVLILIFRPHGLFGTRPVERM